MNGNLTLALVGLGIVFMVQVLITLVVSLVRRIDRGWQDREERQASAALDKQQNLDTVTVVLIAAAVATIVGGRHRIRSVRRLLSVDSPSSPWSSQGRATLQGSHVLVRRPQPPQ
ncbi:MAG: OadG family protein [Candidatus Eisenbacteria bacterium]|nr:OadG family protein [Candidatus Eisenbacteria bacterium]